MSPRRPAVLAAALALLALPARADGPNGPPAIAWVENFAQGVRQAQKERRPILVEFYLKDCGVCRRLERETLHDPGVVEASRDFVAIRVEVKADPATPRMLNVGTEMPEVLVLGLNGERLVKAVGYTAPDRFKEMLEKTRKAFRKHLEIVKVDQAKQGRRFAEVGALVRSILERKEELELDENDERALRDILGLLDTLGAQALAKAREELAGPRKVEAALGFEWVAANFPQAPSGRSAAEERDRLYTGPEGAAFKAQVREFQAAGHVRQAEQMEKEKKIFGALKVYELAAKSFPDTPSGKKAAQGRDFLSTNEEMKKRIAAEKEQIAEGWLGLGRKAAAEAKFSEYHRYAQMILEEFPETRAAEEARRQMGGAPPAGGAPPPSPRNPDGGGDGRPAPPAPPPGEEDPGL